MLNLLYNWSNLNYIMNIDGDEDRRWEAEG